MSKASHKWTIVTQNGDSYVENGDYYLVLDKLYEYQMTKKPKEGFRANMLFMDGRPVVDKDLIQMAVAYAKTREEYVVDAVTKARMEHKPEWLEIE